MKQNTDFHHWCIIVIKASCSFFYFITVDVSLPLCFKLLCLYWSPATPECTGSWDNKKLINKLLREKIFPIRFSSLMCLVIKSKHSSTVFKEISEIFHFRIWLIISGEKAIVKSTVNIPNAILSHQFYKSEISKVGIYTLTSTSPLTKQVNILLFF